MTRYQTDKNKYYYYYTSALDKNKVSLLLVSASLSRSFPLFVFYHSSCRSKAENKEYNIHLSKPIMD